MKMHKPQVMGKHARLKEPSAEAPVTFSRAGGDQACAMLREIIGELIVFPAQVVSNKIQKKKNHFWVVLNSLQILFRNFHS